MLEGIRELLYFLGVDPIWPILIIILLVLQGLYPWRLRGKSIKTKDKNGNTVTKYYQYRDY